MTNDQSKTAAIILSTLGILFMLAMAFQVLPFNIAIFAGVSCFILSGAARRIGRDRD